MFDSPSVLLLTTQTWLQVTRIALRFVQHGARLSVICPEESHLTVAPGVAQVFRFRLLRPLQSLRHAIAASGAEYLLPADDLAVLFLHELWEQSPELRPLIERSLGNSRFYPLLRSRPQLLRLASDLGIAIPETRVLESEADLEHWNRTHALPCVLKRDCTWGGNGVHIARSAEESMHAHKALQRGAAWSERTMRWLRNGDGSAFARLHSEQHSQITAQDFIDGTPANAMFACHRGRILGALQAQVLASIGATGPSLVVRMLDDARMARAGTLLAASLQLSGFFGLDFMLDRQTGIPYLLELNPRLTRLGHLGLSGQPDLAGLLWQEWTGTPATASGAVAAGDAIAFYPDGQRLLAQNAALQICRVDLLASDEAAMRELSALHARKQARLRRRAWLLSVKAKKALRGEVAAAPYYHTGNSPEVRATAGAEPSGFAVPMRAARLA